MDGSSVTEIIESNRETRPASSGIVVGIAISMVLWAVIALAVLFALGRL